MATKRQPSPRGRSVLCGAALAAVVATGLSGCGTSDFCAAVVKHQDVLNRLGADRSTAGFTADAEVMRDLGRLAPGNERADYRAVEKAIRGVLAAQETVGIPLEAAQTDAEAVEGLSRDDRKVLETAYQAFTDTVQQRTTLAASIESTCNVDLT